MRTRIPFGAPQALAAGAGSAWVSAAGAPADGTLPASACGAIVAGGREPDVLIASDLPLRGLTGVSSRALVDAIQYVISERGFRAGKHTVGYQSCDNSTAQTGNYERRRCAANANAFARADDLVAVIGPVVSDCAQVQLPMLNRAPGGPLALVSPSTTYPGLTRAGFAQPGLGYRGEPGVYYPTGRRNFMRLIARDDLQGVAQALLARRLGVESVYLLSSRGGIWKIQLVDPFRRTARRIGLKIAGEKAYDAASKGFDGLVERIARSGADGVVLGGELGDGGSDRLLVALRDRLGPDATIMTGDGFTYGNGIQDVLKAAGPAARGLYVATPVVAPDAAELSAAGRRFESDFGSAETPLERVPGAAQAAEIVMDAIARSDGSRESVLAQLQRTRVEDGILGSFRFDSGGDMTPAPVMIVRVTGRTPPGEALFDYLQGAAVERVVNVPARLAR